MGWAIPPTGQKRPTGHGTPCAQASTESTEGTHSAQASPHECTQRQSSTTSEGTHQSIVTRTLPRAHRRRWTRARAVIAGRRSARPAALRAGEVHGRGAPRAEVPRLARRVGGENGSLRAERREVSHNATEKTELAPRIQKSKKMSMFCLPPELAHAPGGTSSQGLHTQSAALAPRGNSTQRDTGIRQRHLHAHPG